MISPRTGREFFFRNFLERLKTTASLDGERLMFLFLYRRFLLDISSESSVDWYVCEDAETRDQPSVVDRREIILISATSQRIVRKVAKEAVRVGSRGIPKGYFHSPTSSFLLGLGHPRRPPTAAQDFRDEQHPTHGSRS